jgi:hypothetical protein
MSDTPFPADLVKRWRDRARIPVGSPLHEDLANELQAAIEAQAKAILAEAVEPGWHPQFAIGMARATNMLRVGKGGG